MSLFKRFVTTVSATVDRTVASIENHQAIVDVALRDSRLAVSRAKVRLLGLQKDGNRHRNRLTELRSEIDLWSDRARAVAEADRPKALECLQRRKQREAELAAVQQQLADHEKIEQSVKRSVEESQQRVETLQQQRNQMRTRESAAEARRIVQSMEGRDGGGVEDVIERWEVSVGEAEFLTDTLAPMDSDIDDLASEFISREQSIELEGELDKLLASNGGNSHE